MLQRKALTHQHVRSRSCLLHGKRRRVCQRTRGEAVGADSARFRVRAVLGEQGEQLASAPTTTPPVKAIAGAIDSVSVQTPTVVTSDISTWNSPSSTGVTSTPTSVTRIEQGVRRD